jgi:hypothetical protein
LGKATPTPEQRRLVARWRASSLSMAAFARAHRVRPGTFATWVARHPDVSDAPEAAPAFIQVTPSVAPSGFVVHVDDRPLRFDAPPPPAWFAAVLRELDPC